jgi:hypothetical protein
MAKPPKDATSVLHAIADVKQPIFEASIVRTIEGFTGDLPTKQITDLLKRGAFSAVELAIDWQDLHDRVIRGEISEEYLSTLTQAGDRLSASTAKLVKDLTGVEPILTFDGENPYVQRFINEAVGNLVTNITENSRASIRQTLQDARVKETTIAEVAREIKQVVGLRPDQQRSLSKYKEKLKAEGVKGQAFRDLTEKFSKKKLAERANLIARTETMTAVNGGHRVGWEQAAGEGYFDQTKANVVWIAAAEDGRLCPTCESMDRIPRPFTGTWKVRMLDHKGNYTGRTKEVRDPNETHPNCRCTFILELESGEPPP